MLPTRVCWHTPHCRLARTCALANSTDVCTLTALQRENNSRKSLELVGNVSVYLSVFGWLAATWCSSLTSCILSESLVLSSSLADLFFLYSLLFFNKRNVLSFCAFAMSHEATSLVCLLSFHWKTCPFVSLALVRGMPRPVAISSCFYPTKQETAWTKLPFGKPTQHLDRVRVTSRSIPFNLEFSYMEGYRRIIVLIPHLPAQQHVAFGFWVVFPTSYLMSLHLLLYTKCI